MNNTINSIIDDTPTPKEIAERLSESFPQGQAETIAAEMYQPIYDALKLIAHNCG